MSRRMWAVVPAKRARLCRASASRDPVNDGQRESPDGGGYWIPALPRGKPGVGRNDSASITRQVLFRAAKVLFIALACVLLLSGMLLQTAHALTLPQLTGRVVDGAGVLDNATRAALTQKLAELEAKTTDQLVVVTLPSLQGTSI